MAEPQIIGALIASAAYGITVQLSVQCIQVLLRTKRIDAKTLYHFIYCYVASTLLIATVAYLQGAIKSVYILRLLLGPSLLIFHGPAGIISVANVVVPFVINVPIVLPFAVANADTFMVRTQLPSVSYLLTKRFAMTRFGVALNYIVMHPGAFEWSSTPVRR